MHFSRLLDFEDIYSELFDSSPFFIFKEVTTGGGKS